jgi:ABC-type lipoprotein release transport system permease subunit
LVRRVKAVLGALVLTRVLSSFSHLIYGVAANDPVTLAGASLLLVLTAVVACYIPARRAAMVSPNEALRQE